MSDNVLQNKVVLVAEDNPINQMVVKHALLKLGAASDIASDGVEVIEKFKENHYDLILMDIQMPLKDGYETTAYIRNQLKSSVPIIAMTAFAIKGEDEKCFECGMNGYVSKPFTIEGLNNVIQKALSIPAEVKTNPYIFGNKNVFVDVSILYDISGNDESYIHTMVQTFLENMPNTLRKIEESIRAGDWENVYRSAHYAKSSLSVIKISEMLDWVMAIEKNAKNNINLSAIPALFVQAKEKFLLAEKVLADKFNVSCHSG